MKLSTRDFGIVEVDESEIVTFTGPIFGFESYRKFVFLYQEDISEHFIWLQSVENPDLCFILVQPSLVMEPYEPRFPAEMQELLGNGDYMCWLLVSIRDPFDQSTVNLKSPIVVNPACIRPLSLSWMQICRCAIPCSERRRANADPFQKGRAVPDAWRWS